MSLAQEARRQAKEALQKMSNNLLDIKRQNVFYETYTGGGVFDDEEIIRMQVIREQINYLIDCFERIEAME